MRPIPTARRHAPLVIANLAIALLVTTASVPDVFAASQPSGIRHSRDAGAGETHRIDVDAPAAGHLLSGTLQWRGTCEVQRRNPFGCEVATVSFLNPAGRRLKEFSPWRAREQKELPAERVGFVADVAGRYTIEVTANRHFPGSYVLALEWRSPAVRLDGTHVHPRQDYRSERIDRLTREMKQGISGAVGAFWSDVSATGTPIIEVIPGDDQYVRATVVWRALYETHNVLVRLPQAVTRPSDYYMTNVAGTDVWHKTVRLWSALASMSLFRRICLQMR